MLVYIDNNILIDHENENLKLPHSSEVKYVYSYVHLQELGERLSIIKDQRLRTIEDLTERRYVGNDANNRPAIYCRKPSDMFERVANPEIRALFQRIQEASAHWKVDDNPKFLLEKLGIEKKVVNNYSPEILVEKYGDLILHYIAQTSISGQEIFQSLFNILNAIGFWQDRVNMGSTLNRIFDANHAYFATACDNFVTKMLLVNYINGLLYFSVLCINYVTGM
ncbi:MAG: hypothetical protein Q4E60_08875 [Bacteroidales bacterium]|nr:hypothetical protein [Bacteroidales bacterium]